MKVEIKRWDNQEIIICGEYKSIKDCLQKNPKVSYWRSNLRNVDLTGANLRGADLRDADLRDADLRGTNLMGACLRDVGLTGACLRDAYLRNVDLTGACLRDAYLKNVDLTGACLRNADLRNVDLTGACLRNADLRGADLKNVDLTGIERYRYLPDLYILKMQDCKLKAWKYLVKGKSPYQRKEYKVGRTYKFDDIDTDEREICSRGGNVATLQWCLIDSEQKKINEFIEVEFDSKDIVMPIATDGKFRVSKFRILRKITRKKAIKLLR